MWNEITDGKLLPLLLYDLYIQNKFFVVASNYKLMNKLGVAIHCHMFSISWFKLSIPSLFGFVSTWTFVFVPSKAEGETSCQKKQRSKAKTSCHIYCWIHQVFCFGYLAGGAMGLGLHERMLSKDCISCASRHGCLWCCRNSTSFTEIGVYWHFWPAQWKLPQGPDEWCIPQTRVCVPLQVNITLKDGLYLQSVMLPHELFHCMWERYNAYFLQTLTPAGEPGMRFFWDKFQNRPPQGLVRSGQKCSSVSPGAICWKFPAPKQAIS